MNNKVTFSINFLIIKQNTAEEYKAKNKIKRKKKKKRNSNPNPAGFLNSNFPAGNSKSSIFPTTSFVLGSKG